MMVGEPRKLAVLGSPIGHSKSPALHRAAYAALGLNWSFDAVDVSENSLADFVNSRDDSWLGLSLTMPLKRAVVPLLDRSENVAIITGSTNTVVFRGHGKERTLSGFNTDVYGLAESFRQAGITSLGAVHILGGGATAASAIAAVSLLSASSVTVLVRDVSRARALIAVGDAVGVAVHLRVLENNGGVTERGIPDAIISTLPGGTNLDYTFSEETRVQSILFDVAYDPWPSALSQSWTAVGGQVISGIHMLINQALMQVRIFVSDDGATPLANEGAVVAAMRSAVGV
jgi:shikimate dehydrogenase